MLRLFCLLFAVDVLCSVSEPTTAHEHPPARDTARRLQVETEPGVLQQHYSSLSANVQGRCDAPPELPTAKQLLSDLRDGRCLNMIDEIFKAGSCDYLVAAGLECESVFAPGKAREGECDVTCGYCTHFRTCTEEYDYVIVGGGTAGCVLARRLSDNPDVSVLLLEDSVDSSLSQLRPLVETPRLMYETWDEQLLTSTTKTMPEAELHDRRLDVLAGRGLGGTTAINAALYTRPRHEDFDEWGVEGWTAADSRRYFERLEDHEIVGPTHGHGGPLRVEQGEVQTIAQYAMSAAENLGLPIISDSSSGDADDVGISFVRRTIRDGKRLDAFSAYLKPILNRTNLQVRTNSRVVKINMEQAHATGVSYLTYGINKLTVKANREVVLCAGVYGSPQLLLLSGIGPEADLRAKQITPLVDLPVGRGLIGRPMANLVYSGTRLTPEQDLRQLDPNSTAWHQFQVNGSGILSLSAASIYSPLKSTPSLPAPDFIFELAGVLPSFKTVPTAVLASCQLATATSRGAVTLNQPNPLVPPAISLNLFADDDIAPILHCLEVARSLLGHPTMQTHTGVELVPGMTVQGSDLEEFVRSNGGFTHHAVGTCRLGADGDSGAVVDRNLRVRGVRGLRVADASVIPKMPRCGPMSVVYMVAEAAAELILEDHLESAEAPLRTDLASPAGEEYNPRLQQAKDWLWQCSSVEKESFQRSEPDDLKQQVAESAMLVVKVTAIGLAFGFAVEMTVVFGGESILSIALKQHLPVQTTGDNSLAGLIHAAHDWTEDVLLSIFAHLARLCATWPKRVIAGTWIICLGCCGGFYWLQLNDDISVWIPSSSRVEPEFREVHQTFPELRQQALFVEREDGGNMLDPEAVANIRTVMSTVLSLQSSNGVSAPNICVKLPGTDFCLIEGPLEALDDAAQQNTSLSSSAITMTQKPVLDVLRTPDVADTGEIISATGIYVQFYCKGNLDAIVSWERAFEEANLLESLTAGPKMRVLKNSHGAYHDAVNWTIIGAIPYYILSAFFMQVYIFIAFGSKDFNKSQVTLGLCGEIAVLMASLSAGGTYSALGYEVTHISVTVLFLLMGIGLDDMFVLMKAFERKDVAQGIEARLVSSMQEAGSSITVTTLTNIVAFCIGGQLPFPALSAFCIFLALGVGFILFFFLLFFVSCMVIDEHRKQNGNVDLIFRPFTSRSKSEDDTMYTERDGPDTTERKASDARGLAQQSNRVMSDDSLQDPSLDLSKSCEQQEQAPDQLYRVIEHYWAPWVLHVSVKVRAMWCVLYGLTFCAAIYGIWTIEMTPQRKKLGLQDGTDLMEYFDIMLGDGMSHRGIPLDIVLGPDATRDADKLRDLTECLLANEYTVGTVALWPDVFKHWLTSQAYAPPLSSLEYGSRVHEFLSDETSGMSFANDIVFDQRFRIVRSRIHTFFRGEVAAGLDPQVGLDAMRSVQQCTDMSGLDAFPFCESFATDWAEIGVLNEAFVHGLGITLFAVGIVTMLMPGVPPKNAMWMCIVLIMCIGQIVGWISLSGMTFWAQTLAQATIAVGLAVDYSLHIGHAFGHSTGHCCGKRARAQHALTSMGSSVLRGATTTALGILPLFLGEFGALKEFANNVLIIVVQGLFHGFVLLPLALCTFGASHEDDYVTEGNVDCDHANDDSMSSMDSPVRSPVENDGTPPRMFEEEGASSNDIEASDNSRKKKGKRNKKRKGNGEGAVAFENPVNEDG